MPFAKRRQVFNHVASWVLYSLVLIWMFNQRLTIQQAIPFALINAAFQAITFYINYSLLVPKFYFRKRLLSYFLLVAFVIIAFSFCWVIATEPFLQSVNPNGKFPPPPPFSQRSSFVFRSFPLLFFSILVILVSTVMKVSQRANLREQEILRLRAENADAELKFLKSQINPHFLFNALNNIYSLSIASSELTPQMLLKLSSILRYLIYDCQVDQVPLEKEIAYIENYVELQKLKDEGMQKNIKFSHDSSKWSIAPMLLIPFIENAFKHSKIEDIENGWIHIKIKTSENGIFEFSCENSLIRGPHQKDQTGGIGLNNVRQRLELLYPNAYELNLEEDHDLSKFTVYLKILLY